MEVKSSVSPLGADQARKRCWRGGDGTEVYEARLASRVAFVYIRLWRTVSGWHMCGCGTQSIGTHSLFLYSRRASWIQMLACPSLSAHAIVEYEFCQMLLILALVTSLDFISLRGTISITKDRERPLADGYTVL